MDYYNYCRTHQGYKLKKNGYRIPAEAHFSGNLTQDLTQELENCRMKISESIRGEKDVEENLNLTYDSVKIEEENKEVLWD